jgi:hypothetical protein
VGKVIKDACWGEGLVKPDGVQISELDWAGYPVLSASSRRT